MTEAARPHGGDGRFLRSIDSIDRDRRAAELITQGWTYEQVAEVLQYSDKAACWRAVRKVRAEAAQLTGTSEDIRRAQLAEIAEQRARLWQTINDPPPLTDKVGRIIHRGDGSEVPDSQAIHAAHGLLIQLSKREGGIRGTDAPRRSVSLSGKIGVSEIIAVFDNANPQDLHDAIEELNRRVQAERAQQELEARAIAGYTEPAEDS